MLPSSIPNEKVKFSKEVTQISTVEIMNSHLKGKLYHMNHKNARIQLNKYLLMKDFTIRLSHLHMGQ